MGRKGKKQVDVIGEIIECLIDSAKYSEMEYEDDEITTDIPTLTECVYDTDNPTKSQKNSVYRSVGVLEKKGILYSRKIKSISYHSKKVEHGGRRYEKEVCAIIKNGKVIKKC